MAAPLLAALGLHAALVAIALTVRPRALQEVVEALEVTLLHVTDVPAADIPAAGAPADSASPVAADLQEAQMPEAVAWPATAPLVRPAVPRAPARTTARMSAATNAPATVEAPRAGPDSATVSAWQAQLSAWVERNRRYPPVARFRQEEGVVQVQFELDPTGRVLRVEVQRESGSSALDAAALALLSGATLPAPPRELAPALRVVTLPIRYRLQ